MINEKEIELAFSKAMEQGGPACMGEIIAKREAIFAAFNDYLECVEKHYFEWGYQACLDDMTSKN